MAAASVLACNTRASAENSSHLGYPDDDLPVSVSCNASPVRVSTAAFEPLRSSLASLAGLRLSASPSHDDLDTADLQAPSRWDSHAGMPVEGPLARGHKRRLSQVEPGGASQHSNGMGRPLGARRRAITRARLQRHVCKDQALPIASSEVHMSRGLPRQGPGYSMPHLKASPQLSAEPHRMHPSVTVAWAPIDAESIKLVASSEATGTETPANRPAPSGVRPPGVQHAVAQAQFEAQAGAVPVRRTKKLEEDNCLAEGRLLRPGLVQRSQRITQETVAEGQQHGGCQPDVAKQEGIVRGQSSQSAVQPQLQVKTPANGARPQHHPLKPFLQPLLMPDACSADQSPKTLRHPWTAPTSHAHSSAAMSEKMPCQLPSPTACKGMHVLSG